MADLADDLVPHFALRGLPNGFYGMAKLARSGEPVQPWVWDTGHSAYVHATAFNVVNDSHRWLYAEKKRLEALLERINLAACYASEENTDARAETLLLIGQLARGEVMP